LTAEESGRRRSMMADGARRWRGSRDWLNSTVADTLSATVMPRMRTGVVSCTKAHSSGTVVAVSLAATRALSKASRGPGWKS